MQNVIDGRFAVKSIYNDHQPQEDPPFKIPATVFLRKIIIDIQGLQNLRIIGYDFKGIFQIGE
jgi:hypothetical protein